MTIRALHIPCSPTPVARVEVDERNAMSYYPYVHGGPVEGGYLTISDVDLVCYVNSRYLDLGEDLVNGRASQLFELAGAGMSGGAIRGDTLLVLAPGDGEYEKSMPPELVTLFMQADME